MLLRLASFTQLALFSILLVNGSDLSQNLGHVVDLFASWHSIAVNHENHSCCAWRSTLKLLFSITNMFVVLLVVIPYLYGSTIWNQLLLIIDSTITLLRLNSLASCDIIWRHWFSPSERSCGINLRARGLRASCATGISQSDWSVLSRDSTVAEDSIIFNLTLQVSVNLALSLLGAVAFWRSAGHWVVRLACIDLVYKCSWAAWVRASRLATGILWAIWDHFFPVSRHGTLMRDS